MREPGHRGCRAVPSAAEPVRRPRCQWGGADSGACEGFRSSVSARATPTSSPCRRSGRCGAPTCSSSSTRARPAPTSWGCAGTCSTHMCLRGRTAWSRCAIRTRDRTAGCVSYSLAVGDWRRAGCTTSPPGRPSRSSAPTRTPSSRLPVDRGGRAHRFRRRPVPEAGPAARQCADGFDGHGRRLRDAGRRGLAPPGGGLRRKNHRQYGSGRRAPDRHRLGHPARHRGRLGRDAGRAVHPHGRPCRSRPDRRPPSYAARGTPAGLRPHGRGGLPDAHRLPLLPHRGGHPRGRGDRRCLGSWLAERVEHDVGRPSGDDLRAAVDAIAKRLLVEDLSSSLPSRPPALAGSGGGTSVA